MTTVYRERDRYDDSRSVASTRRGDDDNRTYTKVTRYVVREDDDDKRSSYTTRRRDSPERETIRITRREVEDRDTVISPSHSRYIQEALSVRGREDATRSPRAWEREEETKDRELVIRRTEDRDDGRRETGRETLTVATVDDRRDSRGGHDYDVYRSGEYGRDRDLAHYSRTMDYYGPPAQPQTIIIRQDPIIIRERVRDDDYQIVKRSDADDARSVTTTRRDDRRGEARDEEYFYEKKVRERFDDRDDEYDRKSRRELSPGDSISQVGQRRDHGDRGYSSDDSIVYVKRVEKEYSRESSRENKKDLAAGVIAGVGAAELLRNHRKKEGKETSSGIGRVGRDVGAGAIGAIAAEGIRRYRSKSRHGSRSRAGSEDSYDRRGSRSHYRGRSRSRSRSGSRSRLKTLGALGLGAVAIAAATAAVTRKQEEKTKEHRRSRSRRRRSSRGSVESLSDLENDPKAEDSRNPKRRNSRIAAAGAIGAAGAALLDRARNKSGSRERSRSKIREGLPIAAAGLGTAALAGLYEKNKAKKEAEAIQKVQRRSSRTRSRSRSQSGTRGRSDSQYDDRSRSGDGNWGVEYGHGDVSGNNYGANYYARPPQQEPFYGNETAMVPAGRTRSRSRSVSRDRRGMRAISPPSDHEGRAAITGAAAGAAAASEHERRKAEKRERKARRRQQSQDAQPGRDPYEDAYPPQQMQQTWTPPPPNDPYAHQQGFGGQYQSQFPPPPGSMPAGLPNQFQPQYQPPTAPTPQPAPSGRYTPQGFNPQSQFTPQPPQQHSFTPQPNFNQHAYPPPDSGPQTQGFNGQFNAPGPAQYGQQPRNRGAPEENVSAGRLFSQYTPPNNDQHHPDGVNTNRSIDNLLPFPHSHTPSIAIHPPTNSSTPSLNIPRTYVPPAGRSNTPPTNDDQGNERRVQFAASPDTSRSIPDRDTSHHRSNTNDSDDVSPDARRQRRRQQDRGYEAGDDTDLSPNSERRASKHSSGREQSNDRGFSRRNSDRGLNAEENDQGRRRSVDHRREKEKDRERRPSTSSANISRDQAASSAESDGTVDLPARFDEKGRKKAEKGDDPVADRIDDILKGRGTAGKVFGNFMDGLFGPDAKGRKGSVGGSGGAINGGEGSSRHRKDKDRE